MRKRVEYRTKKQTNLVRNDLNKEYFFRRNYPSHSLFPLANEWVEEVVVPINLSAVMSTISAVSYSKPYLLSRHGMLDKIILPENDGFLLVDIPPPDAMHFPDALTL